MPRKVIKVYTERFCCSFEDMRPLCDSKRIQKYGSRTKIYDIVQCKHCGTIHEYYSYMDTAGSPDWNYRPVRTT